MSGFGVSDVRIRVSDVGLEPGAWARSLEPVPGAILAWTDLDVHTPGHATIPHHPGYTLPPPWVLLPAQRRGSKLSVTGTEICRGAR